MLSDDGKTNKVEISIELIGADELIQKLQEIKKLLNDIASIKIEVNQN